MGTEYCKRTNDGQHVFNVVNICVHCGKTRRGSGDDELQSEEVRVMYFIIDKAAIVAGPFASIGQVVVRKDLNESAIAASATTGHIVARFVGDEWVVVAPTTRLGYRLRKAMQTRVDAKCPQEPPSAIYRRNDADQLAKEFIDEVKSQQAADMVNAPPHYNQAGIECIDAIAAATSGKIGIEAVCVANVIKYLWRYELKNGVEDVKKARWYLDRLIGALEK